MPQTAFRQRIAEPTADIAGWPLGAARVLHLLPDGRIDFGR